VTSSLHFRLYLFEFKLIYRSYHLDCCSPLHEAHVPLSWQESYLIYKQCYLVSLQCFDTVGWATGIAPSLRKVGCCWLSLPSSLVSISIKPGGERERQRDRDRDRENLKSNHIY